ERPARPQPSQAGAPPTGQRPAEQGDRGRRGTPHAHLRPYGNRQGSGGRQGGPARGGQRGERSGGAAHQYRPKAKAHPQTPITKKMIEGKEPMRTFGDLLQFMKVKDADEPHAPEPAAPTHQPEGAAPSQAQPADASFETP